MAIKNIQKKVDFSKDLEKVNSSRYNRQFLTFPRIDLYNTKYVIDLEIILTMNLSAFLEF